MESYWERRVNRRRALAAGMGVAGAVTVAGIVGAGCGGGSGAKSSGTTAGQGSLIFVPKDTTGQAKAGGTYEGFSTTDVESFDPIAATTNAVRTTVGNFAYSRLMHWKTGVGQASKGEIDGDLVASWELSGDATQISMKLKPNAKWDSRAPTNSRAVDSEDVSFSFDRFKKLSPFRADWFNDLNAFGPVTAVQTPDRQTVVLKLAFPFAALYENLANTLGFWVMPRESDGGFNPKQEARGSGAWYVDKYETSVGFQWKRNPNWNVSNRPFLDGWSMPVISEYAQLLSQFRAGNLWGGVVQQQDIIQTKKDLPDLLLLQGEYGAAVPHVFFGWLSPIFRDERVRQAMSMLIDRDTFAAAFSDSDNFSKQGVSLDVVPDNVLGAGWGNYWLDPRSKDAGDSAQYFKFDIANAKKLLAAAGHPDGFDTVHYGPSGTPYGTVYDKRAQTIAGMLGEGGIKVTFKQVGYQTEYVPNYIYTLAFDGISTGPGGLSGGPINDIRTKWHSDSKVVKTPYAPSTVGKAGGPKDAQLDSMVDALVREPDRTKAASQARDIQRYLMKAMYIIPFSYQARALSLTWPWVGNAGVYQPWLVNAPGTDVYPYLWFDGSKKKA